MGPRDGEDLEVSHGGNAPGTRRWRRRLALGLTGVALIAVAGAWISRERIAGDAIDDYLGARGVPATYRIVSLTPSRQVIENLVVGDPARPDLTVRRMVIDIGVGWQGPHVRRVTVDGARAFATLQDGVFSLGKLDPLLFTGSDAAPALPALDVVIRDARALVESDYGRVGIKLEGAGRLDDGFAGTIAASAPGIGTAACRAGNATLYGTLRTAEGAPSLDGPLRLTNLACGGARLARADVGTRLRIGPDLAAADADFAVRASGAQVSGVRAAGIGGNAQIGWSQGRIALGHELALTGIAAPQGRLSRLALDGNWRGAQDGSSGQWEGGFRAAGLAPASDFSASLAALERSAGGTLAAPLLARARTALASALTGSSLRGDAIIRHKGASASLVVPQATLSSRRGVRVLALSRLNAAWEGGAVRGLGGSLVTGGEGLPAINGRIAQSRSGGWSARLNMADYAAGPNRLAIPRLRLTAAPDGAIRFAGQAAASGVLPGGMVRDLALPLEGRWSQGAGLMLGTRCTPIRFAQLSLSGLTLANDAITLCPEGRGPMLAYASGLRLAARSDAVELNGTLGDSPASLSARSLSLRYPAPFMLADVAARIGTGDSEVRISAASLTGRLGAVPQGSFTGGTARLAAVPFDLDTIAGGWRFANGALRIDDAAFTLSDRPAEGEARFKPLAADAAQLTLADGRITANALLRHRESGRLVAEVAIRHTLASSTGGARLTVPGLLFDRRLQPEDLSDLAKGVIAFADGTVSGEGRIDWADGAITSSGRFASDGFDFAAAFGPVRGVKGTVVFTDLLNLTTAPDQRLAIGAINPGIEVLDGTVQFELADRNRLTLEDARFPFMGGTLTMRPLVMDFSRPEERRYVFDIEGLDAATFVAQMELANLSATGVFDGTVPIVFDANGNGRIEGGLLTARPGGGNIAYLGDLAYENLGAMGNYAFSALRSLDYREMNVTLGGDLAGEIVTSFNFDGIRQGAGTSQNFITRRLAKLPIQFRINVRSQNFSQLAMIARGLGGAETWLDLFEDSQVRSQVEKLKAARERARASGAAPVTPDPNAPGVP